MTDWIEAYCARCFWEGALSAFGFMATFAGAWRARQQFERWLDRRRNRRRS